MTKSDKSADVNRKHPTLVHPLRRSLEHKEGFYKSTSHEGKDVFFSKERTCAYVVTSTSGLGHVGT
ncbi:hypothetical protein J14TS2_51150 [Bacillus sp. J14TS2]|nr:hypothetical protein J14TS2_51150 [Bacillus sp. J14TS2]